MPDERAPEGPVAASAMSGSVILRKAGARARGGKGKRGAKKSGRRVISPRLLAIRIYLDWSSAPAGRRRAIEEMAALAIQDGGPGLKSRDAALVRQIVLGVVRWQRLLEWHLRKYAKRFGRLCPEVRAILLTGAYQIIFLSRIPFFAAVDESVKAASALGCKWARGLINAVLRKVAAGKRVVPDSPGFFLKRCGQENFSTCLARFSSHPSWMVRRWIGRWGREQASAICYENNLQAPTTLRVNILKTDVEGALEVLRGASIQVERAGISPQGLILQGFRGRPSEIPGFSRGWFSVQDEAAQLVSLLLAPEPGMEVLDLCAGLGGKSTHIAELMGDEGRVHAYDPARARLELLRDNCSRLGIRSVCPIDREAGLEELLRRGGLDRVLVDAPCSGLGVIRRHPDIKWNRTSEDIEALSEKQFEICLKALRGLGPGGRMVYAVCTLEEEETKGVVSRLLRAEPGLRLVPAGQALAEAIGAMGGAGHLSENLPENLVDEMGCLRILPGSGNMDGFFAALFEKPE